MPKVANFRAGSVIYFQGDLSDKIYILQSGKVVSSYTDIDTGKDLREFIQTGEFFGVKSALGKYPREETAAVIEDANVLVFTVPEFEQFSMANTRIIMKMLKVFSNQLRRIHKQVETLLEKGEGEDPEAGLYKTGEYYLKNRMYSQARYVFSRYLTYYPAGKMADGAARNLEIADTCISRHGDGKGPVPQYVPSPQGSGRAQTQVPQAQNKPVAAKQELNDAAKAYYNGMGIFGQGKYREAALEFKKIIDSGDEEYSRKASFDFGRCLFMLGQYDACIKHFTQIVQQDPQHPELSDILFHLGQSYGKKGDKDRAIGFLKKILTMEKDEDNSTYIKAKKALRALQEA
jgi:CRP-like cAMP-binding protein